MYASLSNVVIPYWGVVLSKMAVRGSGSGERSRDERYFDSYILKDVYGDFEVENMPKSGSEEETVVSSLEDEGNFNFAYEVRLVQVKAERLRNLVLC